jgi:DNA ligase-4
LFFGDLLTDLFNPLNENKKRPTGPKVSRAKVGPHGPGVKSAHEVRRSIIERFISKWRKDVGDDFYPALRLILPEKDRDRLMYGLKEKGIGKIIVRMLSIAKGSDDASDVLNWKLPAKNTSTQMAGDFAGRCHELLKGRAMVNGKGDMRIAEVNELLDELSKEGKEDAQLKIFDKFYHRMSADEMMWLIRIILRQMKIGASEKTILEVSFN